MMKLIVSVTVLLPVAAVFAAPAVLRVAAPTYGLSVPPKEWCEWKGCHMATQPPRTPEGFDAHPERDFFTLEYGRPLEAFSFETGTNGWSRLWGVAARERNAPSVRFGRGWERHAAAHHRLEMEISQNVPETEWNLVRHMRGERNPHKTPFVVRGNGPFFLPMGMIGLALQHRVTGVGLECLTSNAHVTVKSLRIAPYTYMIDWRRRFTLGAKPFRGGVSFQERSDSVLTVNGRVVRRGDRVVGQDTLRVEIGDYLKAGENEIVFSANFYEQHGPGYTFHIDAFAVDPDGTTHLYPSGDGWERRRPGGPWQKPQVVGRCGFEGLLNGTVVSDASFPLHPGPLAPKPANGSPYPLFGVQAPAVWSVAVPPALAKPSVSAVVRETLGGKEIVRRRFEPKDGMARCAFDIRTAGAYTVAWKLLSATGVVDRAETEMVVTGPLDLPTVAPEEMEAAVAKGRKLVQKIDCAAAETNPSNFIDHACHYHHPRLNAGRVVTLSSGRYRETGDAKGDLFMYRLDVGRLGAPHLLEFDYPDDGNRAIYCAIMESYPVNFCNNAFPVGTGGWPNATGAVQTGGLMPVSGKRKTLRILFFPGSPAVSVYFENGFAGSRAAVSEIRVYEADGLPAMALPPTEKVYGNHNERPLMHPWGAFVTPKIYEYERNATWRKWAAAYWSAVNRIRQLKFCGQNASIEGGYMYTRGFPSKSGASEVTSDDFDYLRLLLAMYRANGIRAYLSYEYTCAPDVTLSGARSVGDRENWAGTARPADQVDRYGRQITGHGQYANFLHPAVWHSMTNVLGEMYGRYRGLGVEGVAAQTGWLWLPSFGFVGGDVTANEVGYDDDTVEAFARDTGVSLGLPKTGGERFRRRYELLTGRYRDTWHRWRQTVVRDRLDALRRVVRTDAGEKWEFWVSPSVERARLLSAFATDDDPTARRDFYPRAFAAAGIDPSLYDDRRDGAKLMTKIDYGKERTLHDYGAMFNAASSGLRRRFAAQYVAPEGLNEHMFVSLPKAPFWWWTGNMSTVHECKPAGANAMYDVIGALADAVPARLFHTWLDMNIPTSAADEERRAALAYYQAPTGVGEPMSSVSGIEARRYGDKALLVNNTPYAVTGPLELGPFSAVTVDAARVDGAIFRFDASTHAKLVAQAKTLRHPRVRAHLPEDYLTLFDSGRAGVPSPAADGDGTPSLPRDTYARAVLLRDYVAMNAVERALGEQGLSDYVNGQEVKLHAVAFGPQAVRWRADATNATVRMRASKSVGRADGVTALRLGPGDSFILDAPGSVRRRDGCRLFAARMRVRGTVGNFEAYGSFRTRFDLHVADGKVRPAAFNWPKSGFYHVTEVPLRQAVPTDTWFDFAVEADPDGEARVYVDGLLMAREELTRVHGERQEDQMLRLNGSVSSKADPGFAVEIATFDFDVTPSGHR